MKHTPHQLVRQHEHRLKHIKEPLIPQNRARLVLCQCSVIAKILDRSIHRARKDQPRAHIHDPQRDHYFLVTREANLRAAMVEDGCAEDKEGNHDELQHEASFEEDGADVEEVVR